MADPLLALKKCGVEGRKIGWRLLRRVADGSFQTAGCANIPCLNKTTSIAPPLSHRAPPPENHIEPPSTMKIYNDQRKAVMSPLHYIVKVRSFLDRKPEAKSVSRRDVLALFLPYKGDSLPLGNSPQPWAKESGLIRRGCSGTAANVNEVQSSFFDGYFNLRCDPNHTRQCWIGVQAIHH